MKLKLIDAFAKLGLKRDAQLQEIRNVIGKYKDVKDLTDAEIRDVLTALEAKSMTDEEYNKLLERLIKGAEYLERNLTPAERAKGQKLYDELEIRVKAYKKVNADAS